MNPLLANLTINFHFTGEILKDSTGLLKLHGNSEVAEHTLQVANNSVKIAHEFGVNEQNALIAGCLHDISRIFPEEKMIHVAEALEILFIDEERQLPSLLHPKISRVIAEEVFKIESLEVLEAIECHSTLKANPTQMDMVLFIADKMSWDAAHNKGFIENLMAGLEISLEHGALAYLKYIFDHKEEIAVIHPQVIEAYTELSNKIKKR